MPDTRKRKSQKSLKRISKSTRAKTAKPSARKTKQRLPRTLKQYLALPAAKQDQINRTAQVISIMRTKHMSLRRASEELSMDPRVVMQLGRSGLRKDRNGKYVARKKDSLFRALAMDAAGGPILVGVRSSKTASEIGKFEVAVQKLQHTGDASGLRRFTKLKLKDASGKRIRFLTDPRELRHQGSAGIFIFETIYARSI